VSTGRARLRRTVGRGLLASGVMLLGAAAFGCGSAESAPTAVDCTDGRWAPTADDQAVIAKVCTLTEACCVTNAYRDVPDIEGCEVTFVKAGISRDARGPRMAKSGESECRSRWKSRRAVGARTYAMLAHENAILFGGGV
jgi:hypothetical protein